MRARRRAALGEFRAARSFRDSVYFLFRKRVDACSMAGASFEMAISWGRIGLVGSSVVGLGSVSVRARRKRVIRFPLESVRLYYLFVSFGVFVP